MLKGFRDFILRGNVVDLAVGVMVGAAFSSVVNALVKDLMTPIIAAIFRQPDFSRFAYTLNGSQILYGDFLNALISFLIVAVSIYFFIVTPVNTLMQKFKGPAAPKTKKCPECQSDIPLLAKRCPQCTSALS